MRTTIYLFLFLPLYFACKKPKTDQLSGERTVKGTLYLNDTLNGLSAPRLLANHNVQVKLPADSGTQNFLLSLTTDAYGNFSFDALSPGHYRLWSQADSNHVLFTADRPIDLSTADTTIQLVLYADTTQYNLLNVICLDTVDGGRPLSNVQVCLFTSALVSDSNQCTGSFTSGMTNMYGRLLATKLPPGRVYINALDSAGTFKIKAHDYIDMPALGLREKIVTLKH